MRNYKITISVVTVILVIIIGLLSNQHSRWLIINGISATQYSNKLLANTQASTPDWAMDMVINSNRNNKTVIFSEHNSLHSYAYSINGIPQQTSYVWSHMVGSWYVVKIKNLTSSSSGRKKHAA